MEDMNLQHKQLGLKLQQVESNFEQKFVSIRSRFNQGGPAAGGSAGLNFQAYEESIEKLETETQQIKLETASFRDRTSLEVRKNIEMTKALREDLFQRIKNVQDDLSHMRREN